MPHAAQGARFPSRAASAPRFFQSGLTPKNRGADAAPLRCLIADRARALAFWFTRRKLGFDTFFPSH